MGHPPEDQDHSNYDFSLPFDADSMPLESADTFDPPHFSGAFISAHYRTPAVEVKQEDLSLSQEKNKQAQLESPSPDSSSFGSSSRGSSSGSSNRFEKSASSESSPSLQDVEDFDMNRESFSSWAFGGMRNPLFGVENPTSPPNGIGETPYTFDNDEQMDTVMENAFDFDSASASGSPFNFNFSPREDDGQPPTAEEPFHSSQTPHIPKDEGFFSTEEMAEFEMQWSREPSNAPSSSTNIGPSQQSSPSASAVGNTPPVLGEGAVSPLNQISENTAAVETTNNQLNATSCISPRPHSTPSPVMLPMRTEKNMTPLLKIEVLENKDKSRVETQIPVRLSLHHIPRGISKLHLPPHTISKPKLLLRPTPEKSSNTLELHTMLVCASAMRDPIKKARAFARAAGTHLRRSSPNGHAQGSDKKSADEDDEEKTSNGGEVKICAGCMTRERKRAARKKQRKVEDEEHWKKYEAERVIVFNTHEIKDWVEPTPVATADENKQEVRQIVPDYRQIDLPMRIACYCRHHNEKQGFQVIFTLKDHKDEVIAQGMSSPIIITDDHKTHTQQTQLSLHHPSAALPDGTQLPGAGVFSSTQTYEMPHLSHTNSRFRISQSSPDLPGLLSMNGQSMMFPATGSQLSTAPPVPQIVPPRNLSRQASPSFSGPVSKKRKASTSKIPMGLAMTTMDGTQGPNRVPVSTVPSTISPQSMSSFSQDYQAGMTPLTTHVQSNFVSPISLQQTGSGPLSGRNEQLFMGPPHRHSIEQSQIRLLSTPTSSHTSRPPTPGTSHTSGHLEVEQTRAQLENNFTDRIYQQPPTQPAPVIHKIVPSEGPKSGGIEVTILGSDFYQGLDVVFGDELARTTTFWGPSSLVCYLPPATHATTVPVTFRHQHPKFTPAPLLQPTPTRKVYFKYTEDDQDLMRLMLEIIGRQSNGQDVDSIMSLVRQIVSEHTVNGSWTQNATPADGSRHQLRMAGLNPTLTEIVDLEEIMLNCLDRIRSNDHSRDVDFDIPGSGGHTLLHFAASLGFRRLLGRLLELGANPEMKDNNHLTPMYFALLNGHSRIVHDLYLAGADFTLPGARTSALASGVSQTSVRLRSRPRSRSVGAYINYNTRRRSSTPADVSIRSPSSTSSEDLETVDTTSDDDKTDDMGTSNADSSGYPSPSAAAAAFSAWADQLAAQIQHFQQTVQKTLPNWEMPKLPPLPTLPDTPPMVQRISSLLPHRATSPSPTSPRPKELEQNWWQTITGPFSSPPAYDELYPDKESTHFSELKKSSALRASADAAVDLYYDEIDNRSKPKPTLSLRRRFSFKPGNSITANGEEQLRLAQARQMSVKSDRKLFFIWIPLLVFLISVWFLYDLPEFTCSVQSTYVWARQVFRNISATRA